MSTSNQSLIENPKIEALLVIARSEGNDLTMSIYGNRRHSYFVGLISTLIHQLQHREGKKWEKSFVLEATLIPH